MKGARITSRLATVVAVAGLVSGLGGFGTTTAAEATPVAAHASQGANPPSTVQAAVSPKVQKIALAGVDAASLAGLTKSVAVLGSSGEAKGPGGAPPQAPALLSQMMPTRHFTMVGVTWAGGSGLKVGVNVRVREAAGWTSWESLDPDDLSADPGSTDDRHAGGRAASEVVWSSGADAVQVRLDTATGAAPSDVQAVLIDSAKTAADAALPASSPVPPRAAQAARSLAGASAVLSPIVPQPAIISRAAWGADESLKTCVADTNSTVQLGFVHHTVNANDYTPDQVPALIRAMYAFHVQGRGWCDLGYNFLVDRFGRAYEGRFGGIDRGVVGAQVGGFNSVSTGVATIGDFTAGQPSAAMVSMLDQVLAWKLSRYNRDPHGRADVVSAGSTLYPAGTRVSLNVISGHRDGSATSCPGDNLYPLLPSIRDAVGNIMDAAHAPIGNADAVQPVLGGLWVKGWALDPDSVAPIVVHAYIDGRGVPLTADKPRPDVAAAYPGYGDRHGFDAFFPSSSGPHVVCLYAINVGPGATNSSLGCWGATVVDRAPFGSADQVQPVPGGIWTRGWAIDPDTVAPIPVHVYIDGFGVAVTADKVRADVGAAYPGYGERHGFDAFFPTQVGTHQVCVYGINVGGTASNTTLGCWQVTVR